MSFRKRNVGIADGRQPASGAVKTIPPIVRFPGCRPSAADGRLVTSSGSASFDGLFAGHGGIPMGSSVLIEESGTTDYAGALLRFYASEGLVQGHIVHVVGLPESWSRDLPGLAADSTKKQTEGPSEEKLKIAWRYDGLGQHGPKSGVLDDAPKLNPHQPIFCHNFDLSKRLEHPPGASSRHYRLDMNPAKDCFGTIVSEISMAIKNAPADTAHRIIVPSLTSPALYPSNSTLPQHVLGFEHAMRKLLSRYSSKLTLLQTLPLSLFPRSSGLTKWIEILSDGIFVLTPFPHSADAEFQSSRDASSKEPPPQGLFRVHKLPIFHDLGKGTAPTDTDWTFNLSRRKFNIKPFNLPPIEGDTDAQHASLDGKKPAKSDMDF